MSKPTKLTIDVLGTSITVLSGKNDDYISLTDMLKAKDGDFLIGDWLRNRNTVEFLGIWERVHNPDFNYGEFDIIKSQAGLNSYRISVKDWVAKTNALGLRASAGRYGGTYAHKDIAFEFGMWISAEFKIYLIKEFQRLKDEENDRLKLGWNQRDTGHWIWSALPAAMADDPTVAAARLPVLCGFRRFWMGSRAALAQLTWLPIRCIKSHRFVISAPYHFRLVDCQPPRL